MLCLWPLTGRTKELSSELKKRFVEFSQSLGLSDTNIIFLNGIGKSSWGEAKGCGLSKLDAAPAGKWERRDSIPCSSLWRDTWLPPKHLWAFKNLGLKFSP